MVHFLGRAALMTAAAFSLNMVMLASAPAAPSERMKTACTSDYLKFCGQYDPDSFQTIHCMKRHERSISRECRQVVEQEGIPPGRRIANKSR